jgi:rSAM/selenodomain-associated transferase 1
VGELVIVFAKAPVAGRVKTRLIPYLGSAGAARLQQALVGGLLQSLRRGRVELHTDVETAAWPGFLGVRRLQAEGDLGSRMQHALAGALHRGASRVVLIGGDCPYAGWPELRSLLETASDVAFGPALDGGFWGIRARRVHPEMFRDVVWSRPDTLRRSLEACARCGLTTALGPPLADVDDGKDLARLYMHLRRAPQGRPGLLPRLARGRIKVIHF